MQLTATPDHHILLCLAGTSPAVITETLWALRDSPAFPNELHVVTTSIGQQSLRQTLESGQGALAALCADYHLTLPEFEDNHVHVPVGQDGVPLDDIRSAADNNRMADTLVSLVRRFTADPSTALHVSIAGGRKTMGFFGGYALSLLGRAQDRLTHVLVDPDFENNPLFHYPKPHSMKLTTRDGRIIDAQDATVELVDIPFVRLRQLMPEQHDQNYSTLVDEARPLTELPDIQIELEENTLVIGHTRITMEPQLFLFYLWLLRERLDGRTQTISGLHSPARDDLTRAYQSWHQALVHRIRNTERTLKKTPGPGAGRMSEQRSRINGRLKKALGKATAQPFMVQAKGGRNDKTYSLSGLPVDYLRQQLGQGARLLELRT